MGLVWLMARDWMCYNRSILENLELAELKIVVIDHGVPRTGNMSQPRT